MSVTSFIEYVHAIQTILQELISLGNAQVLDLKVDPRSSLRGYIAGSLRFDDDSELHFREFVDIGQSSFRLSYAFHYQDSKKKLVFRYDNAAHKPPLSQLDHKHTPFGIELVSVPPSLGQILDEIL